MMPRDTALTRLRRQLADAEAVNRNAVQQLLTLRAERDRSQNLIDDTDALNDEIDTLRLQKARLEGYIDRVREMDGVLRPNTTLEQIFDPDPAPEETSL